MNNCFNHSTENYVIFAPWTLIFVAYIFDVSQVFNKAIEVMSYFCHDNGKTKTIFFLNAINYLLAVGYFWNIL